MSLTIRVSWPARALWPNAKTHWAAKAKSARSAREEAFYAAKAALDGSTAPGWKEAEVWVVYHRQVGRPGPPPDRDNVVASLKPYADGIADAGVILNDRYLRWGQVEEGPRTKRGGVTLTVREAPVIC